MKNVVNRSRNFVRRNRNTIVAVGALGTVIVLQQQGIRSLNAFLKDNGLFEQYYLPETEV
jgi:hypothetical protein